MNKIIPKLVNTSESQRIKKGGGITVSQPPNPNISFKSSPKAIMTIADDQVLKLFSQHYGNIGPRLVNKVDKLVNSSKILANNSRFATKNGQLTVIDKSIPKSIIENVVFPFTTLPRYGASWVLKKAQRIPSLEQKARTIYNKPFFRTPRKLNELNDKSNQLKGIFEKTRMTVDAFIKEKGLKMTSEELIAKLNAADDSPIIKEANEYIKENLYKASNKFFDKHTGNFNTAFERPLNRIVTGLIPVAFLANDAYNLSVLCGDKKEDSEKEAKSRISQEVSRVFTTAYIQLLTFGAFTKQVNTIPWFTPLTSAATVLFSETTSRKRLGKPIFFLSKEKAKEYNKKEQEKLANEKNTTGEIKEKAPTTKEKEVDTAQILRNKNIMSSAPISDSSVFASFKAKTPEKEVKAENKKKEEHKEKKALINFNTFKKGVGILIAGGFALSFLKNSSYTKNSKVMQSFKKAGKWISKKVYEPLAFKKFEIKNSDFDDIMSILDDVGCKEIADGHRFIKNKYFLAETSRNTGSIMMHKHSISASGTKKAIEQISETLKGVADDDVKKIVDSIKVAIGAEGTSIAEMKYEKVAKKATEIIRNKKVNLPEGEIERLSKTIVDAVRNNADESAIMVETKLKPFVDIITQPFKFIMSAANLPFKMVKTLINMVTSPIQKKAAQATLGKAELTKFESAINKAVVEVFGENKTKSGKISQTVFANAMEQLKKQTEPYRIARANLSSAIDLGKSKAEIDKAQRALDLAKKDLQKYVNVAVEKSFDGVTQSSNKNTDLAMMTKLASSAVTSAFLVADNYNMVMIKSNGEDTEGAKEKANERIIQRLSALFYQSMLINWFNSTFKATYNSSLLGMTSVAIPNTLTTEVLTRSSIGMPIRRKSYEELVENERKNENRTGFLGKYFKFMRLLTGKKPLKDRMPRDKQETTQVAQNIVHSTTAMTATSTNLLDKFSK